MSNQTNTVSKTLDEFDSAYARGVTMDTLVSLFMTEEMEGYAIFLFGDNELFNTIMDAYQEYHNNYYADDFTEPGLKDLGAPGVRFFDVLTQMRAKFDVAYANGGCDYLTPCAELRQKAG